MVLTEVSITIEGCTTITTGIYADLTEELLTGLLTDRIIHIITTGLIILITDVIIHPDLQLLLPI